MQREQHLALRRSLIFGAIYDLAVGLTILLWFPGLFLWLNLEPPEDRFLLYLSVLPLMVLPVLYWRAATTRDALRYRIPVLWARGGGGAMILALTLWLKPEGTWVYLSIGAIDIGWAFLHAVLYRRP
ncbi:MAG: hypothetical protein HKN21_16880 [Candidatus Eisenbacteria bacterium]|uniref:Uncharacterized protein n=1 Tax=Eiseniibacteriota bacterium TaxID=2212470 RepID=A0A7Y2H458_UNCEI|nr:hypothetical protein [Candidatus Eisenbacteria bacterium]